MATNIIQFGKGLIGSELIKQVKTKYPELEYCVTGRSEMCVNPPNGEWVPCDHYALLEKCGVDTIFVDVTSAEGMEELYKKAWDKGSKVVVANKKAGSSSMDVYRLIHQKALERKFFYETTVGAGLPIISTLQELINTGDEIVEIQGCFSGTLGFICSALDSGAVFSDVVKEAKKKGFTEPDPRDDLNGMDVARKALILAREIGMELEMDNLKVESLVRDELLTASSVDDFMTRVSEEDSRYKKMVETASENGEVIRFVASISHNNVEVGLKKVLKTSPIGSLSGPDNIVVIKTKRYSINPLVIQGPGAGAEVTAAGVFGDILKAM